MKSFHLSEPKFDIAGEMFCVVEFSNFLLGQKFIAVKFENAKIGPKKANFAKGAHLYSRCKNLILAHIIKCMDLEKCMDL